MNHDAKSVGRFTGLLVILAIVLLLICAFPSKFLRALSSASGKTGNRPAAYRFEMLAKCRESGWVLLEYPASTRERQSEFSDAAWDFKNFDAPPGLVTSLFTWGWSEGTPNFVTVNPEAREALVEHLAKRGFNHE